MSVLPLKDIRIVELGTHVAVPHATRLLADWGAEVIKIETPKGDEYRKTGASYNTPITDDENPLFFLANMNKKLISINMKTPEGMELFMKLIKTADVFISSIRMKAIERMGISYKKLKAVNPKLIYCHLSGFGYEGPDSERPGFDVTVFWARSGALIDPVVEEGGFPAKQSMGMGDSTVSSILACGIMTALYDRRKTGEGCFITSSLYSGAIWYNFTNIITTQDTYGNSYPKKQLMPANPFAYFYRCRDGKWLCITCAGYDHHYAKVMNALYRDDMVEDARYSTLSECAKRMPEFVQILNETFANRDCDEWCERLDSCGVACDRIVHYKDVSQDPQAWANKYLSYMDFESGHRVAMPNPPIHFSSFEATERKKPGCIGADTREVLLSLGLSQDNIDYLAQEQVIIVGK